MAMIGFDTNNNVDGNKVIQECEIQTSSSKITDNFINKINSLTDQEKRIDRQVSNAKVSNSNTLSQNYRTIFKTIFSSMVTTEYKALLQLKALLCLPFSYLAMVSAMPRLATATDLQQVYWKLVTNKWKEGIDGRYHHLGPAVFDLGLHGGTTEPGYLRGLLRSFIFISNHLGEKLTVNFYLNLHKVLCAHFLGEINGTLMGQEKVGVFRDSNDEICWNIRAPCSLEKEALQEYYDFELQLRHRFNLTTDEVLGWLYYYTDPNNSNATIANQTTKVPFGQFPPEGALVTMRYRTMFSAEVDRFMTFFIDDFYQEIEKAKNDEDAKLTAIARLSKRIEWLHPTRDGSGRTDMAVLNKVLTEHGFHPVFLNIPWFDIALPLAKWKNYLNEGLLAWEQEKPASIKGRV